jgi:hypothetical protein
MKAALTKSVEFCIGRFHWRIRLCPRSLIPAFATLERLRRA